MMETVWVQRGLGGVIKGVYANRQPGYAEEELPADDAEVIAFFDAIESSLTGKIR
jgi:hypothetical protein